MTHDLLITDFEQPLFTKAFQAYFTEFGIHVQDWDGLWKEMNRDGNFAFVRVLDDTKAIGFILCQSITSKSWFFEEKYGFIREFWVDPMYRNRGYGTELLHLAETYFFENNIKQSILTTDSAENFYLKNGYKKRPDITAKNRYDVFVKEFL